ncbi:MAG: helix-turn-helix transcriptional regulator [Bacteroidales bacterium]|nr:helix-turn-helix transcriptional regulator [Bacteroidales bacterium]
MENDILKKTNLNRIKVVLVEKGLSNNWLAENLGKSKATVSRWCTNDMQPSLETFYKISKILKVDIRDLIVSTKDFID